ncbi:MAG: choice-of-anchor J domain-containing protein [Muribaculaceae bacterium]|nr:choice-of-anchor J domain-containing protein [Muribaculaceae bacterium]
MRNLRSYIGLLLLTAVFTGCQDDFDNPGLVAPRATLTANTTIRDFKTGYWQDGLNYIAPVRAKEDGSHVIISGYVVSSDRTGNIYKNLVIQDETGALAMSINQSGLYNNYRVGQEVVIDVTDMYIGKYNGLQQLGWPDNDEVYGEQATFMPMAFFSQHAQLNGLPDEGNAEPAVVELARIASFTVSDKEEMIEWQSRLVRFNNVRFEDGKGTLSYTDGKEINSNRTLYDEHGNQIVVRNSGYATFWSDKLPKGYGDVVGILSYYDDAWQLLLRSTDDCMNFGNPTINLGTEDNPYTVPQAIDMENAGTEVSDVWVKGYIVGAVASEVVSVKSNEDIDWVAHEDIMNNTLVIAGSADVRDIAQCLVISLPAESKLREYANLRDNPDNLGKEIMLRGNLGKYMDTYGITGNNGTSSEFKLAGAGAVTMLDETFEGISDASQLQGWTSVVVAGDRPWYFTSYDNNTYAACTAFKGTDDSNGYDSWLITPPLKVDGMAEKSFSFDSQAAYSGGAFEVYAMTTNDPATATLTKLECKLATPPASGYSGFVSSGKISLDEFSGTIYIGFRYTATTSAKSMTYCIDNVKAGISGGSDTPDDPTPPATGTSADFNTFNDGSPKSSYGTYSTAAGWTLENGNILSGRTSGDDSNPYFSFIGEDGTLAANLNGKVSAPGKLTSPALTGGIKKLTFNYGFAYSDKQCQFTVNVKQDGVVKKTETVTLTSIEQKKVYTYTMDVNISGDFTVEIVNDAMGAETGNKERVAIWNLSWTD